jgi:crotonobetainyl-CoA:carnitine CoA-transferase CaiB-like acyl-CoA transferase
MSVTGALGGPPQRVSTALSDIVAGLVGALGTTAALRRQSMTGVGEIVDVSLLQSALALMSPRVTSFLAGEDEPAPSGATDSVLSIYQSFPTEDRPIVVAVGNDPMWRRFCVAVGLPDLGVDPAYATNEDRRRHRRVLVELISQRLATKKSQDWLMILADAGIPASLVNSLSEVVADAQLNARNALLTLLVPGVGDVTLVDSPWRFGLSGTHPDHLPPPRLGFDTIEVLREANIGEEELNHLLESGVAWSPSTRVG